MSAGQNSDLNPDIANLIELASIRTTFVIDNLLAEDAFAHRLVVGFQLGASGKIGFRYCSHQIFFQVFDKRVAFGFGVLLSIHAIGKIGADFRFELIVISLVELRRRNLPLRLAGLFAELIDGCTNLLNFRVSEFDGVNHRLFFYFFRAGLDHHDAFGGADNHDVQKAVTHFAVGRIHDKCAVHQSHSYCADWAKERNI